MHEAMCTCMGFLPEEGRNGPTRVRGYKAEYPLSIQEYNTQDRKAIYCKLKHEASLQQTNLTVSGDSPVIVVSNGSG